MSEPTTTEIAEKFSGHRLRQVVAEVELEWLADAVGVHPSLIARLMQAEGIPTSRVHTVIRIAEVLDYPVQFFLFGRPHAHVTDVHICQGIDQ